MEILTVLLILALSEKNPQLKESLQSVLKFYRENRALIMAFAGNGTPAQPSMAESASANQASDSEKLRVLEEFLKRQ